MATRIRLKRTGRRGQAAFRLVVVESAKPRDGAVIEEIGSYNPHTEELLVDRARALEWLKRGAQPTPTAKRLLSKAGVKSP